MGEVRLCMCRAEKLSCFDSGGPFATVFVTAVQKTLAGSVPMQVSFLMWRCV